jgi:hypothetical protein
MYVCRTWHWGAFVDIYLTLKINKHYIFWDYVFRIGVSSMQCACVILPSGICPALQNSSTLCLTQQDFRKKKILSINICLDFLYKVCLEHFLLYETWVKSDENVNCCYCKVPVILVSFEGNLNFIDGFRKIYIYQISWQSLRWKSSCSVWTEGYMDGDYEANSRFSTCRKLV